MIRRPPRSTPFPTRRSSDLIVSTDGHELSLPGGDLPAGFDAPPEPLWLGTLRGTPCWVTDRKSTRLNSSHGYISYAVFCLKKKKKRTTYTWLRAAGTVLTTQ